MTLKDKALFISGGSRGIGLEIGLRAARDGANVALIAKTADQPRAALACALGFAAELREDGIASNALWPRTLIATAAVQNLLGGDFDAYAYAPGATPQVDLFVDHV
jgi:NAD(P)-dependent dehydrogenase (short-subunit alcohol dehydrogenase family)